MIKNYVEEDLYYDEKEYYDNQRDKLRAVGKEYLNAFNLTSDELNNDREIILSFVSNNGFQLERASEELKNDKEIVLAAVRQNGSALIHASKELGGSKEVEGSLKNYLVKAVKEYNTNSDAFRTFLTGQIVTKDSKGAEDNDDQKSQNELPLLNKLGKYRGKATNKEIAEYAGARIDHNKDWALIKQACINLGMENILDLRQDPPVKIAASGADSLSSQNSKNNDGGRGES